MLPNPDSDAGSRRPLESDRVHDRIDGATDPHRTRTIPMPRVMRTASYGGPRGRFHTRLGNGEYRQGHLYYVRLRTRYGRLYKIGYTSLASVEARLTHERPLSCCSIDRVLIFQYRSDAERLEQQLHGLLRHRACFTNFRGGPEFPLFQNGQSELYHTDVLSLDASFRPDQASRTNERLELQRRGIPEGSLRAAVWKKLSRWSPELPADTSTDHAVADLVARAGLAAEVIPARANYVPRHTVATGASVGLGARACGDETTANWLGDVVRERKAAHAKIMAALEAAAAASTRSATQTKASTRRDSIDGVQPGTLGSEEWLEKVMTERRASLAETRKRLKAVSR